MQGRLCLGIVAEQGSEAQEGVLLLHIVPDVAQGRAPDAYEVLQVGRYGHGADPGHATQGNGTAIAEALSRLKVRAMCSGP